VRLRLDANGAWDVATAEAALRRLAVHGIELVEDPVAGLEELASLRRRSPVPVAAEMCVRTVADAARLRALDAADAVVLKPQRIGGVAAALAAAAAAGVPAIASSALETSVGLAAVLALAAALPESPVAHGAGTALLLAEDVTSDPLIPVEGRLRPRRVVPDAVLLLGADPPGSPARP
jgi:O-succinylbenzoate synthase